MHLFIYFSDEFSTPNELYLPRFVRRHGWQDKMFDLSWEEQALWKSLFFRGLLKLFEFKNLLCMEQVIS